MAGHIAGIAPIKPVISHKAVPTQYVVAIVHDSDDKLCASFIAGVRPLPDTAGELPEPTGNAATTG